MTGPPPFLRLLALDLSIEISYLSLRLLSDVLGWPPPYSIRWFQEFSPPGVGDFLAAAPGQESTMDMTNPARFDFCRSSLGPR